MATRPTEVITATTASASAAGIAAVEVAAHPLVDTIVPDAAKAFLAELHRTFEPERRIILADRILRQAGIDAGERPRFRPETAHIRAGEWTVDTTGAEARKTRRMLESFSAASLAAKRATRTRAAWRPMRGSSTPTTSA